MAETRETMIKRMKMRSMRRGIKEMDLILSAFSNSHLDSFDAAQLATYDHLLAENDHDIYGWITGHIDTPDRYGDLMAMIMTTAEGVARPK